MNAAAPAPKAKLLTLIGKVVEVYEENDATVVRLQSDERDGDLVITGLSHEEARQFGGALFQQVRIKVTL